MARGFTSLHPLTEQALRNLGVKSAQVTQGWGSAAASAGYHEAVGTCQGRRFSHCVDLSASLICKDFLSRLWEADFVAFARTGSAWAGNEHIHAVHLGLTADDGQAHLLSGPRAQIVDFLKQPARNGLRRHGLLTNYAPPASLQAQLRKQYAAWLPDYPTRVLAPGGQQVQCCAWLEGGTVTVDRVAFCNWWGKDAAVVASSGKVTHDGRFWREPIRELAQAIGIKVASFKWAFGRNSATVQLAY